MPRVDLGALALGRVLAPSKWLDLLAGPAVASDHHRARQQGVGQLAEARERDRAVSRDFLGLDRLALHHAAAGNGAPAMPGVERPRISSLSFAFGPKIVSISSTGSSAGRPVANLAE